MFYPLYTLVVILDDIWSHRYSVLLDRSYHSCKTLKQMLRLFSKVCVDVFPPGPPFFKSAYDLCYVKVWDMEDVTETRNNFVVIGSLITPPRNRGGVIFSLQFVCVYVCVCVCVSVCPAVFL